METPTRTRPRSGHRTRLRAVLPLVLGCCAVAPSPILAQTVVGTVRDAVSASPLPGVLLSLMSDDGERVGAVLSDDTGRFHFQTTRFGLYRIRAERIGLETSTTETFRLFSTNPHVESILMGDRAVEIEGLVVDSRVRQCRMDPEGAVQIQRWWREVRTALDVSTVVQESSEFRIERFERTWDADLDSVLSRDSRTEMSLSNRPFVSAEADFLAEGGFVQGQVEGQREYYAPDANVLLSDVFLAQHCFSIEEHDDERLVGLSFEPTRDQAVADILGTLWVDSTAAELRSLDFRYANMSEQTENESGGYVSFEYLPSGAWIVREWYIRMPRLARQARRGGDRLVLLGYVDVGGLVSLLDPTSVNRDQLGPIGSIRGTVHDSIRGRGLAGALVTIVGTDFRAVTGPDGAFELHGVPVGEHHLTFLHDEPEAWGLGAPLIAVEVDEERTATAELAIPGFPRVARIVCLGSGLDAEAVLLGHVVDAAGGPLENVELEILWDETRPNDSTYEVTHEARTGSDGHYVICTVPAESRVRVRLRIDGRSLEAFEVVLPPGEMVYRRLQVPVG